MRAMRTITAVALVTFATALLPTAASGGAPHRLYGKHIAGQVVDSETGMPVAGAHVAFLWESTIIPSGFTGHNSRTICYHAAAAITDAQGRFDVPAWSEWSTYDVENRDPNGLVYAPKYVPRQIHLVEGTIKPPIERLSEKYPIKTFSGPSDKRMQMLFWGLANRSCHYGKESQKSLYPMLKAIYGEARSVARTSDDDDTVRVIARLAAAAALATDPSRPENDRATNAFIAEHLK